MKKRFIFFLVFFAGFLSCKNNLTLEPTDFIAPQYFYNSEEQLNQSLIGVYNILQAPSLYGLSGSAILYYQWLASVDEGFNLSGSTNIPQKYDYNSSYLGVTDVWNSLYRGIDRANNLIANIEKPEMDETERAIILGQAKFLRAYYYFMLVSNYGAVPLLVEPTVSVNELFVERTPATTVYDFVTKEMEEAESMVRPISDYDHSGRVSQSTVQGMLARVNLFRAGEPYNEVERYSEALKWANKVINSGLHELNPDYSQVFINYIQDKYDTKENLWEVEFYTTGVGDLFSRHGGWGFINGIRQQDVNLGFSNGGLQAHPKLFNLFDPHDTRRDWSIAPFQYQNDRGTVKVYWRDNQLFDRRVGKWRREYELTERRINNFTSTNYAILRYSDVLLMAAEAENFINGPESAYQYVNEVRQRGYGKDAHGQTLSRITITNGGTNYTEPPTVTISGGGATADATAVASVSEGAVTNIAVVTRGAFYETDPIITIEGTGSGATATATISIVGDELLKPEEYATKADLLKTIQDERSRELAFEGHRRYDLIRWGLLVSTMKELASEIEATAPNNYKPLTIAGQNISEKHIYIPIPLRELTLNPKLVQTDGW
ncbi:hypothetical protein GCM10007415_22620 [Parapedobacter pyrenivorans]|uniref:Starch-binding associating with outer membrane n=1 Tax=Parapedobacter pyrenivorans TaxID=1305674 RepID=A0A917HSV0_9SPHI|nr:RagB/SusD family nutrient uptake outer membrane protein [Parapedobacter pyrenivorans]GGG88139.1 hypothetical protein GCM10007415_22620 [Parapedobacter pyrenivorans]